MKRMKQFWDYLNDSRYDVRERMFALLSAIALVGLFVAMLVGLAIGENRESVLLTLDGLLVFSIVIVLGFRLKKIRLVSHVVCLLLIFAFMPLTFFTSGGVKGGTPVWCVFIAMYIMMIMSGNARYFYIIALMASTAACFIMQYTAAVHLYPHSKKTLYADLYGSIIIVSVVLAILVGFQAWLYHIESQESERQRKEIESLIESQNSFFSSMSHEIRTPINTIIGLNEIILRQNASEEINEDAENIQAASNMLLHLVNDILDISKIESGQMELVQVSYHTGDMLSDVVGMIWFSARKKGLNFHVNVAPDLPEELLGDEVRIKQVLINVLNNAVKYTSEGSVELSIEFTRTSEKQGLVTYTITDTGMGIKKENIPYLFNAFKRVDEEKNRYIEGTGLGLSIVRQLVEAMGGKITVNSIYTKGSTFIIELPQRIVNDEAVKTFDIDRQHKMNRKHEYHQSFEAPDAHILVVDDTEANRMVAEKLLKDTKVHIDTAESGEEALKKTLDTEYQVIFMDHLMPEMDGIECMHKIRDQIGGRSKTAKIVCLTAKAGSENEVFYMREGFDGYLVKPITGKSIENELYRNLPKELVTVVVDEEEIVEKSMSWIDNRRKKRPVIITTESVADMPEELRRQYGIASIPYKVISEGGVFKDGIEVGTGGVLRYMEKTGELLHTRQPDEAEYREFFAGALMRANNVIHISITEKLTRGGYAVAADAAGSFDNVTVIDSGQLSAGQGVLAILAARLAQEGHSPENIVCGVEWYKERIRSTFVIENIENIAQEFQVWKWASRAARAFMVRPMVVMREGKMTIGSMLLGGRKSVLKTFIRLTFRFRTGQVDPTLLIIANAGASKEEMEWVRAEVERRVKFEQIYEVNVSPAIALNCGPGAFGLFYMEK